MMNDTHIGSPVKLSSPQLYTCSASEDKGTTVQLPGMDRKKTLGNDAKDLDTSDSDQQQHQRRHRTLLTSSSGSFHDTLTSVTLIPTQQIRHVKKPFEASPSAHSSKRRGNQGIKAARQKFLLKKAAKLREARTVSETLNVGSQTSETSCDLSKTLRNQSCALGFYSNMSSTSQKPTQQIAAPRPVILLPPPSSHASNSASSTTISNNVYNRSSSHGRLYNDFQPPRPRLPTDYAYLSSTIAGHHHGAQNNWAAGEYLFIKVSDLPDNITTRDLWEAFKHEGHVAHIRLHEDAKGYRDGGARVKFRYAPGFHACLSDPSN